MTLRTSQNGRRTFKYLTYADDSVTLTLAEKIGWAKNVVILESGLTQDERVWYIRAVHQLGWSKLTLAQRIDERAHEQIILDNEPEICYTDSTQAVEETHDESAICLPREDFTQKPLTPVFMRIQGTPANEFTTNLLLTTEPLHDMKTGVLRKMNSTPFVRQYSILLTNGVLFYVERNTEQEIHRRIQAKGLRDHDA